MLFRTLSYTEVEQRPSFLCKNQQCSFLQMTKKYGDQFRNKEMSAKTTRDIHSYSQDKGPHRQAERSGSGAHSQATAGSVLKAKCCSILARFMETFTSVDAGSSTSSLSKEMQNSWIQVLQHSARGRAVGVHRRHLHAREAETCSLSSHPQALQEVRQCQRLRAKNSLP